MRFVKDVLLLRESSLIRYCDKCHLSPGQEKSTSNKGDVIVAFKRHALNLIPSRQLVGKHAICDETYVWLQSWVHECNVMV